jgi:MFS family permease
LYYGWKIVASLFVILLFTSALGFYNHSILLDALATQRGFPITIASSAVSVFFLAAGISGPGIAWLIERYDVRPVIVAGAVMAAVPLSALGQVETQLQLYVLYAVFGVGFSASGLLPATTLITRWFRRNRAMALSVASTGLSLGGIVITPLSAALIESVGLASACPMLGAVYFFGVAPVAILALRNEPASLNLAMDGDDAPASNPDDGIYFSQAIRMRYFWTLSIAYVFVMVAQVGGIAHQYGIVSQYMDGTEAAMALAILPLFSIIGRLAGGMIINGVSAWHFTLVMIVMQAASLAVMALGGSAYGLMIGLALFGITVGNLLMLQPLLIAETFGLVNYARIYAISNMMTTLGVSVGPVAMGAVIGFSGSYAIAYLVAAGAGAAAFVVFVPIRPPPVVPYS